MSSQDLSNAIQSINDSAGRANTTTDFFNRVLDGGQGESVQNPLTGTFVPSVQKAVYDQYKNDINQIQQDVVDSEAAANRAEAAAGTVGPTVDEVIRRSYADAGYRVAGTFQAGFTIVNANDVGIDLATGKGYTGPAGTVAAGTDPTSGGFVDRSGILFKDVIKNAESYTQIRSLHGCGKALGAENSLITYTMLSDTVEVVDCDISTTSDNVPILLHNLNVDGITSGTGSIFSLTAAQVASQRVLAFDGTPYEGQPLTTWSELLSAASRRGTFVTAELKNTQTPTLPNIIAAIYANNMGGMVRLQCLNINRLMEVRAIDSNILLEVLVYDGMPTPSLEAAIINAVEFGNCGINVDINYSRLGDAVTQSRDAGINMAAFSAVYSTDEMVARRTIGRVQITTDYVRA